MSIIIAENGIICMNTAWKVLGEYPLTPALTNTCTVILDPIIDINAEHNQDQNIQDKKEEIWSSPMTKAPTPTEMSKGQSDNTNNATKKFD